MPVDLFLAYFVQMFVESELAITWDQKCLTIFKTGEYDYVKLNDIGMVFFGHKTKRQMLMTLKMTIGKDCMIQCGGDIYIGLEQFEEMWRMIYFSDVAYGPSPIMMRYPLGNRSIGKIWYKFINYNDLIHDIRIMTNKHVELYIRMYRLEHTDEYVMVPYYNNQFGLGRVDDLFGFGCVYEDMHSWSIIIGVGMIGALGSMEIFYDIITSMPIIVKSDDYKFKLQPALYTMTQRQQYYLFQNSLIDAFNNYDRKTRQPIRIAKILGLYKVYQNKNCKTSVVNGVRTINLFGNEDLANRTLLNVFKTKSIAKEAVFSSTLDKMRYINEKKLSDCIVGYSPRMFQLTTPIDDSKNKLTRVSKLVKKSNTSVFIVCYEKETQYYIFATSPVSACPTNTILELAGHDASHEYDEVFRKEYSMNHEVMKDILEDAKNYAVEELGIDTFKPDYMWFEDKTSFSSFLELIKNELNDYEL